MRRFLSDVRGQYEPVSLLVTVIVIVILVVLLLAVLRHV